MAGHELPANQLQMSVQSNENNRRYAPVQRQGKEHWGQITGRVEDQAQRMCFWWTGYVFAAFLLAYSTRLRCLVFAVLHVWTLWISYWITSKCRQCAQIFASCCVSNIKIFFSNSLTASPLLGLIFFGYN